MRGKDRIMPVHRVLVCCGVFLFVCFLKALRNSGDRETFVLFHLYCF